MSASVRHEFPSAWAKFQSVPIGGAVTTAGLSLTLLPEHYPFWAQGIAGKTPLKAVTLYAEMDASDPAVTVTLYDKADKTGKTDVLAQDPSLGTLLSGGQVHIAKPAAVTDATHPPLTLYFDDNAMEDLWIALTWGK